MDIARFKEQLSRQLRFLERSANAFDAGHRDEAIRVATIVRVMIHETQKSTCLLTLLRARNSIKLVSTVKPPPQEKGILAIFDGVTTMTMQGLMPSLDSIPGCAKALPVEDWWNQLVMVFGSDRFTRRSIVLAAANKDGGAHVDPQLSQDYQALIDGLWTFTRQDAAGTQTLSMGYHQFIALRQFAHELLNSPELVALSR